MIPGVFVIDVWRAGPNAESLLLLYLCSSIQFEKLKSDSGANES